MDSPEVLDTATDPVRYSGGRKPAVEITKGEEGAGSGAIVKQRAGKEQKVKGAAKEKRPLGPCTLEVTLNLVSTLTTSAARS
ncbi:hypothetical protein BAUCODRAFT_39600 [Baudoinia panamericana UAMH 10762]|uniref:Uncharacterized protein n=1 Tax=Baudoinia panamericana (strain UAMH 10762) TaxID=717646 RepID=M2MJG5_BAUPA|nr:uncharacterized protein BAUCODRAFT_39600 [Baudoinia panamericana UAMH 10762]EMC91428.1 hypothetical protein BAUCODRAFT_39600 [Baudoinia panamericana UAMH 10762]